MKWQISFHDLSKKENIFSPLSISLNILIITSLFHRKSLGASATFPQNGYNELLHLWLASNQIWCGWKDYQRSPKKWDSWCDYANIWKINPFLYNISCPIERDVIVKGFSARVRSGVYIKNVTIKVQGVTDALASISKTIQLAGKPSPLHR